MNRHDALPLAALIGQAILQLAWHGPWSANSTSGSTGWLIVSLLPLLAPLLAARHSIRRGLLVGGIVSLLYFIHGVMEAWANPADRGLALVEIGLALAAIFGLRKPIKPA